MLSFANELAEIASLIGSLTVVGGALMWIYNKFISAPREKKRKREADERQEKMTKLITQSNEPLERAIKNLNELLRESQSDRKQLNLKTTKLTDDVEFLDKRVDNHNERILVLETKSGVRAVSYKGVDDE